MQLIAPAVSFCPMARKEKTVQLGARIPESLKDQLETYCVNHPLQPSIGAVIIRAITEYLDREVPKPPADRPRKRG